MERLTEKHENGTAMIKGCGANCKYGFVHCRKEDWENCKTISDVIDKLADYEDAEEQGLLLRLPCKVGTTVYEIINNTDACLECPHYSDFYGMDSMCSKSDTIFEPRYADMPLCDKQFLEVFEYEINLDKIVRNLNNFGKTVFLTREEAEKALADMGE